MNKFLCGTLLLASMAVQTAYAQDDQGTLPAATTVGNATFLSGGIGLDESTAMQQAAPKYPLELVFGAKEGNTEAYTADVHVKISDHSGNTVIDTVSNGPYLLATLPDGSYKIEASSGGVSKTQQAVLKKGAHRRIVFSWNQ